MTGIIIAPILYLITLAVLVGLGVTLTLPIVLTVAVLTGISGGILGVALEG